MFATTSTGRPRHIARWALPLALTAVLGACGGGDDSNGPPTTTQSGAAAEEGGGSRVVMKLVALKPAELEVDAGTTVTWEQLDAGAHTVTSGTVEQAAGGVTQKPDGRFDSGEIATGDSYEFTFEEPGSYPYYCSLHPATMRGEIRVN